jgi:hypothetical protein
MTFRHYRPTAGGQSVAGFGCGVCSIEQTERVSVVAEFENALSDVVKGAMAFGLAGGVLEEGGVPPFDEFLQGRNINRSIVKKVFDLGHIGGEKAAVGPN